MVKQGFFHFFIAKRNFLWIVRGFPHGKRKRSSTGVPMNVYIATRFTHKEEFKKLQKLLEANGHAITHDWTVDDLTGVPADEIELYKMRNAGHCIQGVLFADALVLIAKPNMAGAFVEMGMAMMRGIPIIVVGADQEGNQPCIFYSLPDCSVFHHADCYEDVIAFLKEDTKTPYDDVVRLKPPFDIPFDNN